MPCSKTHIETLREAAILQRHLSLYRLSSGPLNSVVFVESFTPQRKLWLSKITEQICLVINSNLVLAVIFFYHLSKRNPFLETSAELLNLGAKEVTVMPTPQPCKWMTYAITVCQHAKILTTHTTYVTNSQRTSVGILKCLFRETNIIKFEQCILYKYFKSVKISLIYVCVHKRFEWTVKMWCFLFSQITKWSQY